jgi:4-hydroxythreonine-4-phosphate dehydrogenase
MAKETSAQKPRIAVVPGDPGGIGPELIAKLVSEPGVHDRAHLLLVGDEHVLRMGQTQAGLAYDLNPVADPAGQWWRTAPVAFHAVETIAPDETGRPEVSEAGGASCLRTLDAAMDLARAGSVDGVLFAPLNKAAMHLAGLKFDDEHRYIADHIGYRGYVSEINVLDEVMTTRVTSHIPLKDVAANIREDVIIDAIKLADSTLKRAGKTRPRIAVAALNPHAGDGGNFGREEIDIIAPAVRTAAEMQIGVDGPWPSDTVFLRVREGKADAVVIMYHDQGQIAMKLMGFKRGVTITGGLPIPVATPAHGTAFDIAGKGIADPGATRAALDLLCRMSA